MLYIMGPVARFAYCYVAIRYDNGLICCIDSNQILLDDEDQ